MLRKTIPHGIVSRASVWTARTRPDSSATSSFRHDLDRLDLLVPEQRDGRDREPQPKRPPLARRRPRRVLAEDLDVTPGVRIVLQSRLARRVELQLAGLDGDVRVRELAELLQLGRGEGGLGRTAPGEQDDLLQPRAEDRLDRGVGRVGRPDLLGRERQHPDDVERDVSCADDDRTLARQVEVEVLVVGVAVVPGDELGRRPGAGQVLARNAHPAIGLRADGIDHGVVQTDEVVVRQIAPDGDVAEEPESRLRGDPLEGARDGLDLRMVGCHSEPHEAPRRRQPLDQVDLDRQLGVEQGAGGVEAGRTGADHGDAKRCAHDGDPRVRRQRDDPGGGRPRPCA